MIEFMVSIILAPFALGAILLSGAMIVAIARAMKRKKGQNGAE